MSEFFRKLLQARPTMCALWKRVLADVIDIRLPSRVIYSEIDIRDI